MSDILKPVRECVRGHKERRAPTAIESQLAKRVVELEAALRQFHTTVDEMCGVLGMYGEISARDDRVSAVMDQLFAIDKVLAK